MPLSGSLLFFFLAAFVPGHLFDWAIEWICALGTMLVGAAFYGHFGQRFPIAARVGMIALLVLVSISFVAYAATITEARNDSGARDLVDVLRPFLVYFSCILGIAFGVPKLSTIRVGCECVLAYSLICGAILALEVPGLAVLVDVLYGSTKTAFAGFYVRLSIPFENPNFLGLFAVLSLCVALLADQSPRMRLASMSIAVIALTGSRTAWATGLLVVAIYIARAAVRFTYRPRLPGVGEVLLVAVMVMVSYHYWDVLVEGNQRVLDFIDLFRNRDLSADQSYVDRIDVRERAMAVLRDRPLLGVGSMKYTELSVVDNQYVGLLLRFGVLGLSIVALTFGLAIASGYRSALRNKNAVGYSVAVLLVAVWLWNGSFLENVRLASLIVIFLGSLARGGAADGA